MSRDENPLTAAQRKAAQRAREKAAQVAALPTSYWPGSPIPDQAQFGPDPYAASGPIVSVSPQPVDYSPPASSKVAVSAYPIRWRLVGARKVNALIPDPVAGEALQGWRGVRSADGNVYDYETAHRMQD